MSTNLYKCLKNLSTLSPSELHQSNKNSRGQLAQAEWFLAASLLVSKREQLYRKLDGKKYPDVIAYAQAELNLSRDKTVELLSTARAMERLPLLADAFREGKLSWAKVRELKRVATPETEKVWIDFALENTILAVRRRVAVSPREWKRGQALSASVAGRPTSTAAHVSQVLSQPLESAPVETTEEEQPVALPAPKLIKVVHYLTPDEFALYEQAEERVRSRLNKRVKREKVLLEWANRELSEGSAKARARHQVLIHTTPDSEHAWYETNRGLLPVAPELVQETREQGREVNLDETSRGKSETSEESNRTLPTAVVRQVFARAGNRCECCGRSGCQLDAHHRRAVSDGGDHSPGNLLVLCKVCHALLHEEDFDRRPDWIRARARALLARGARGEPLLVGRTT